MRHILLLFALVAASVSSLVGQEASLVFHPGDPIHILVKFKTPPTPFESANLTFVQLGQPNKAQEQLSRNIGGNQVQKISETEYEITAIVPDHIATGRYGLSYINVAIKGVSKSYTVETDFQPLTVTVVNPEHPEFPAIDSVTLTPHN
jgi:hypothetical protein